MKTTDLVRIENDARQTPVILRVLMAALLGLLVAGCSKKADPVSAQVRADAYFKEGKYDEARIEYMNLLRADKDSVVACKQLGIIWSEQGSPLQAVPFLWKCRELAPDNLDVRSKLGSALLAVGDFGQARQEAIAVLEKSPAHDDALMLLAETAASQQEMDAAVEQLNKAREPDRAAIRLASAVLAAKKRDAATAETEVRKALELDPKSVPAHLALGNLLLGKKDFAGAEDLLKKAADLSPARSVARVRLAEFKLRKGAVDEAKALLTEMTKATRDYLPPWRLLAQIAFAEKKYDESLALLENIFGRDARNVEARLLQAEVWTAKGDPKKAVEVLEALRGAYRMLPAVQFRLAQTYMQQGNFAQAGIALKELVAARPDYLEAALLLGEVSIRNGEAGNTVELMKGVLKKQPGLLQAELLLADAYRALGKFDDAAAVFRDQIKATPQLAGPHFMLGTVLRLKGSVMDARLAFEKAQELAPDNLNASYQLVEMDIMGKNFTAAHQRVQAQMKKSPNSAAVHFLSGWIYSAQRDFDRAEAALLKAIELDPKFAKAYDMLTTNYLETGQLDKAMTRIQAKLAANPDDASALLASALIHDKKKEYPQAKEGYEKVLAKNPEFIPALNNLAVLLTEQLPDLDKAHELARKARNLRAEEPSVADTLGWIAYKRGDYKQALALFTESIAKMPGSPEVQFHLGMAHYMMGQTEVARKALQLAVDSPAEFSGKEEARRRLALLGDGTGKPAQLSVQELEELVRQQPNDVVTRVRLAEAYETQGAIEKAAASYEEALKLNPKLLSAMLKLAEFHLGPVPDTAKALDIAKKARTLAPSDPKAASLLGRANFQAGNFPLAYSLLQESARKPDADAGLLREFAWAAYNTGKVPEAQTTLERLLKASPESPHSADAKSFLAMLALANAPKDAAAAEPEVQKILAANPAHVPAMMASAALRQSRGDIKAAEGAYTEVLGRLPDFALAQRNLAVLYRADPASREKAYTMAMKARKTLPDDAELSRTLAELNFHRKDFASAIRYFDETARKRTLDAEELYYLGAAQAQSKDKSKAAETLRRALDGGLKEPMAADAKRLITELSQK